MDEFSFGAGAPFLDETSCIQIGKAPPQPDARAEERTPGISGPFVI